MGTQQIPASEGGRIRNRVLREDPTYNEIKRMIENFPPENLEKLKLYIQRWLRQA